MVTWVVASTIRLKWPTTTQLVGFLFIIYILTLNNMHVLDVNEIFWMPFYTYDRIMEEWGKNWPDAFALYVKLIKQSRIQQTNQTYSLNSFLKDWLKRTDERLKKSRDVLKSLWLINDVVIRDELGKIKWHYVRVNYLINENKIRTLGIDYNLSTTPEIQGVDNTTCGKSDTNALSNININAWSNKKEKKKENLSFGTELEERLKHYQLSSAVTDRVREFDKCKKWQKISKMNDTQLKIRVDKLKTFWLGTDEWMIRVLENSIANGWQWIFELKWDDKKKALENKQPQTNMDYINMYNKYYLEYREKELKELRGEDKFYEVRRQWIERCASK